MSRLKADSDGGGRRMEVEEVGERRGKRGGGGEEVVRWEKYLPRMVIRVLLVEADYASRQIIAALLRKCNYEVTPIPDGLKAWEILKRRHNDIDLVLTELDLPLISGYALLTLIMEHESCKKVPVIMMSSHDSINMAFNCLLKGAADFLIKPVRRNELKNLWQHLWKRLHDNGGRVSDNMVNNKGHEATAKDIEVTKFPCDDVSSSLGDHESSEKASDAHSSCTTRQVGAESRSTEKMQDISRLKKGFVSEKGEAVGEQCKKKLKVVKDSTWHKNELEEKSNDLASIRLTPLNEICNSTEIQMEERVCAGRMMTDETVGQKGLQQNADIANDQLPVPEPNRGAIDLIGKIDHQQRCTALKCSSNDENNQHDFAPQLELSLACEYLQNQAITERTKLTHSNGSAFSWYSDNKKFQALFPSSSGTEPKGEQSLNKCLATAEDAVGALLHFRSSLVNEVENNGHTDGTPTSPLAAGVSNPQPGLVHGQGNGILLSTMLNLDTGNAPSSPLHSEPGSRGSSLELCPIDEAEGQSAGDSKVESIEPETDAGSLLTTSHSSILCNGFTSHGSSNSLICGNASERTDSQYAPVNSLMHNQVRVVGSNHSAEREAALAKFRLKRKDRCFDKKVRYQSRKRLAEQRPRVKGQFVRHV